MLARALRARFERSGVRYVATDTEVDVTAREPVLDFARRTRPACIVNAAAFTRVDDAEVEEAAATRVNADGPENLARAALELGVPLLHVSTDYVFDGAASAPYREDSPTGPTSAYGRSKLAGEQRLASVLAEAPSLGYVVRTSWLFGDGGPNFVKTMVGLMRERDELRVVDDQRGRPTYTVDLADAICRVLGLTGGVVAPAGTYHFANAGEVSWHGFAMGILARCRELGLPVKVRRIVPVTTAEFPRPARRPAYSVLDTSRLTAATGLEPRPWQAALSDYLADCFAPARTS